MSKLINTLSVLHGSPTQTRLVTPYTDGAMDEFTKFLQSPKAKQRAMIYGATLPAFFDALKSNKKRGVDVKVIFDHTQEAGHYEHPHIEDLIANGWVDGRDFVIGTSPEAHQICHIKATWSDDRFVEDGSLNYSPSAFEQINTIAISDWPEYAAYLNQVFETAWSWILEHEPQYN